MKAKTALLQDLTSWSPHSPSQLPSAYGATEAGLHRVRELLQGYGLRVEGEPGDLNVRVAGRAAALCEAFGVSSLRLYRHPSGTYRGRSDDVGVPEALEDLVDAVFGFDDRRVAEPYVVKSHVVKSHGALRADVVKSHGKPRAHVVKSHDELLRALLRGYWPDEVASLYDFPPEATGRGQQVAVLAFTGRTGERGRQMYGGYHRDLLEDYFEILGVPMPQIRDVVVRGPGNVPGPGRSRFDFTDEVMLDLQVAGALAPDASYVVYFTEPTEQGWVEALHRIVLDEENDPSVLLICYGNPEDMESGLTWTGMAIEQIDRAFTLAALRGITVCCSCGDNGAAGTSWSTRVFADFPSSSPWVLGTGIRLFDGSGELVVAGGTSVSAPVWAALMARINEVRARRAGFVTPLLYARSGAGCVDVNVGDNGAYRARQGWDPCTGWGTPRGRQLVEVLGRPSVP